MNILIDISHPAHVHFFKHAIRIWGEHGHAVNITARDKDVTHELLDSYGLPYQSLSKKRAGLFGLAFELLQHESRLFKIAKNFHADVILDIGGTFIVHAGKLLGVNTVVFSDTEHAKLSNFITFPFASFICTPESYKDDLGKKQFRYNGFQELAYLHPNYFKPSVEVLHEFGLEQGETFFIVRFVSWGASHDVGQKGLTFEEKVQVVNKLSKFGRVIITSEELLPEVFMPYRMQANPTKIHDLLYFASLYIGEGATMASEAALLGTPSIYTSTLSLGYLNELSSKYQLVHHYTDGKAALEKALSIVSDPNSTQEYQARCQQMLSKKADVTAWIVNFVETINSRQ
jgi:hypothetical protein